MSAETVVIGGGLAGLAACVALAERGFRVKLLEARPRLGGRASSFVDRTTGTRIDNCQHVSMGCCTNFRHLCETVGAGQVLQDERTLYFVGPDDRIHEFRAGPWPAPFHLLRGFRRLDYLSREDKRGLARGLRALARETAPDGSVTIAEWLVAHDQTPAAIERFWTVVLVSALSESLDRICVPAARKVFVDGFLAARSGWTVQVPSVPLEELYGRFGEWLTERGVRVRTSCGVERLVFEGERVTGVELRGGERVTGKSFVLAVPFRRAADLLVDAPVTAKESLPALETSPISSVHLWFDRPITSLPHAVFVERLSQWLFNRGAVAGIPDEAAGESRAGGKTSHYYQVVISASRHVREISQEETIARVRAELEQVWPAVREAQLLHARRVTEHDAVFSPLPGTDELRPPQQSPVENLQLAGDWTRTGWPATMEGAVRSGYLAAENVLARRGRRETVLQPDLSAGWLSRLLFGL